MAQGVQSPGNIGSQALTSASASLNKPLRVAPGQSSPSGESMYTPLAESFAGFVTLALFSYSSLVQATLRLLYCVPITSADGSVQRRLFLEGSTLCDASGWQAPLYILLVVLLVFPVLLFAFLRHVKAAHARGNNHYALVFNNLCGVYHDEVYWWEAVHLSQRLLLSIIVTLLNSQPLIRSTLTTAVCVLFFALHLTYSPYMRRRSALAQSVFQVSLVSVSILCGLANARFGDQVRQCIKVAAVSLTLLARLPLT